MAQNSLKSEESLKRYSLIREVFDKGTPTRGRLTTIFLLKRVTNSAINKAAFIPKKNLYNKKIVLRNRFRRILREAYRKTKHLLPGGYDIVILATKVNKKTKSIAIEREIQNAFKKCVKK